MKKDITRKEYCKQLGLLVLGGLSLSAVYAKKKPNIIIGLQTYRFRDKSLDEAIVDMQKLGIKHIELGQGHVQPSQFQWKHNLSNILGQKELWSLNEEAGNVTGVFSR